MGLRFRKSKKILPGVRLNLGAKSAGISFGIPGLRHTINTSGRRTTTVGIPGSGLSYSESSKSGSSSGAPLFVPTADRPTSPKSRGIALALCVLLGVVGVHRYYVGKVGTGLIWTFTGGCFGIGWLIDIFTVLSGGFYDKNGSVVRRWSLIGDADAGGSTDMDV